MAWLDPAPLYRLRTQYSVTNFLCFSGIGPGFGSDRPTQPMWNYSVRYVLVLMEMRSRRVVYVAVTASPTLTWLKQRIREATPFGSTPRFLVHDNDGIFGQFGRRRPGKSGRSYREHLRRTVTAYIASYNQGRPHQGIEGIPEFGPGSPRVTPPAGGGRPDQDHCTSGALRPSPRLPTRRVAQVGMRTLRLVQSGSVIHGHAPVGRFRSRQGMRCLSPSAVDTVAIRSMGIRPAQGNR